MAFLISSIPTLFRIFVRKEYLLDLKEGHGEYLEGDAIGVRCVRGQSLYFQVILENGAAFRLPVEALCWKPCELPSGMDAIQPWDVASETFGIAAYDMVARGAMLVLPGKTPAQYRWSIDFTGSDLADDPVQGKALHICYLENGLIGAFPNNRILWVDPALRDAESAEPPKLKSLSHEFRAEGFQDMFRPVPTHKESLSVRGKPLPNGHHTDPAERPDWQR